MRAVMWRISQVLIISSVFSVCYAQTLPQEEQWPVGAAADGFSAAETAEVLTQYAPLKLAGSGNQALYTYLNMPEFFPHVVIPRQGSISTLQTHLKPALNEVKVNTELGELSLQDILTHPQSRLQGLVIVYKGDIVFEEYPGMRAEDSHLWWSIAKVVTGLICEQLIFEGKVDEDNSIAFYLPEFAESSWAKASVDNVLNMASGIAALDSPAGYADPHSDIGRLIYAEGILSQNGFAPMGHDQALLSMGSISAPGSKYQYSSANTNMLALLIERVTGMRYSDVVAERVWSKIGAEADGLQGLSPDGRPIAHGMFSSRLRDLARFGLLFTPSSPTPKAIPASVISRMRDTQRNEHYRNSPEAELRAEVLLGEKPVNALAQWDALFADGDLFKSGFDGQVLYVSPARDLVIAMFSTSKNKSSYQYLRAIAAEFPVAAMP